MKTKIFVLSCLIVLVVFSMSHERSLGKSKFDSAGFKIGVVSVSKVFENCKRHAKYRKEAKAEEEKIVNKLELLKKEIEADEAGLRMLKPDSEEYVLRVKDVLEKRASYLPRKESFKQYLELRDKIWTEALYRDILEITEKIARRKDLDLVLEKDSVDLPTLTANELMLTIRTHKVLFSKQSMDISDEVLAELDAK